MGEKGGEEMSSTPQLFYVCIYKKPLGPCTLDVDLRSENTAVESKDATAVTVEEHVMDTRRQRSVSKCSHQRNEGLLHI